MFQQTNCSAFHVLILQLCPFRAGLGLVLSDHSNKTTVPALYWFKARDKRGMNFEGSPCSQQAQLQRDESHYWPCLDELLTSTQTLGEHWATWAQTENQQTTV